MGCFLLAEEGMNWFAAAEYCYYQNAMLAQIPDLSTQIFLEYYASEIHTGKPDFWLGATDIYSVNHLHMYLLGQDLNSLKTLNFYCFRKVPGSGVLQE